MEQAAVAYLVVSLLAPLTWMLAIEVCRRFAAQADEAKGQRPSPSLSRLSISIAKLKDSNTWWLEDSRKRG